MSNDVVPGRGDPGAIGLYFCVQHERSGLGIAVLKPFVLFCVFGCTVGAQVPQAPGRMVQPDLVWDGVHLATTEPTGRQVRVTQLENGECRTFPAPPGAFGIQFAEGGLHAVRMVDQEFRYARRTLDGAWVEGVLEVEPSEEVRGFPTHLFPSERPDWFFGWNLDTGFLKGGEASCCAWWRRTPNDKLVLENLIPIEWGGPVLVPYRIDGKPRFGLPSPFKPGFFPLLGTPLRVPGAFIVVSLQSGLLWVIKDRSPLPDRLIDLVGIQETHLRGKTPFPQVILGIQPMRDGRLLVAVRTRQAVDGTRAFAVKPTLAPKRPMDYEVARLEWDAATRAFPDIEWIAVDPRTGKVQKAPDAVLVGAPMVLNNFQETLHFSFGFDDQERMVHPWRWNSATREAPPPRAQKLPNPETLPSTRPDGP